MKIVSHSISKIDGPSLVKGTPLYTDDLAPANALIVKVLRSPHAFAKIRSITTAIAQKIPGVVLILTHNDIEKIPHTRAGQCWPELSPLDTYILDEYVRHVGDAVAIIAATDEAAALKAMKLIKVDYEVLTPLLDYEQADTSPILVHPEPEAYAQLNVGYDKSTNTVYQTQWSVGDPSQVLANCDEVLTNTYYTQAQAQGMMETQRCYTYKDSYDRLVVVSSTQIPFHVRRILSTALNLPMSKIRVIKPRVGGGFGAKQTANAEFFPALVTLLTGKPAKIVYTRREVFRGTNSRHAMRVKVTLGATRDGQIKAIALEGLSDTGAYGEHGSTTFSSVGGKVLPLYNKVEACSFQGKVVYTNKTVGGALRGFGVTQGTFALESAINEMAHRLDIDPVVMREKNMIRRGETTPLFNMLTKGAGPEPIYMESCQLEACVAQGKAHFKWDEKSKRAKDSGPVKRGIGMAITQQGSGLPNVDMASATLKLNDDGFFSLLLGATDIGTGSDTIMAQIAAETLGVSMERIIVYAADTDVTPYDSGAYASSTTYTTGNAVIDAASKMNQLIVETATSLIGCTTDEVVFDGEWLTCEAKDFKMNLTEFSRKITYNTQHVQLTATGSYVPKKQAPPYMAGFVEVAVDTRTGKVEILEFQGVIDCGTPINPKLCKIQAEGGIVQGIGMALFEEARYDADGRLLQDTFMTYKMPTRRDVQNIQVHLVDGYEQTGPYGAKSIGEVVINTPCPAIIDAIYDACGVRLYDLPATPEKILMALQQNKR